MQSRKNSAAPMAALFSISSFLILPFAYAEAAPREKRVPECPLSSRLRVAAAQSLVEYETLSGCSGRIVEAPVRKIEETPDVVRIKGVKERRESGRSEAPAGRGLRAVAFNAPSTGLRYDRHVVRAASAYRIDPLFLHAIIGTESAYRPNAISPKEAIGLMQIIPTTGAGLGVSRSGLFDPATNIDAGARYLKRLQKRYGRNFDVILGAYNAGEGAVARYGNKVPPYAETQAYVRKVMSRYRSLRARGATGR